MRRLGVSSGDVLNFISSAAASTALCVRLMSAALALTEPSGLALGDPPGFVHSLSVPISRTGSRIITPIGLSLLSPTR
jgi:hypothetical protein